MVRKTGAENRKEKKLERVSWVLGNLTHVMYAAIS